MQIIKSIQRRIYEIRGERVMLDFNLASLYEVEARALNQAGKRNIKRFPEDFKFQLINKEFENLRIEINKPDMSSQIVMTYLPNDQILLYLRIYRERCNHVERLFN